MLPAQVTHPDEWQQQLHYRVSSGLVFMMIVKGKLLHYWVLMRVPPQWALRQSCNKGTCVGRDANK